MKSLIRHSSRFNIAALIFSLFVATLAEAQQQRNQRGGNPGGRGAGGARAGERGFVAQLATRDADKSGTLSQEELSGGRMGIRPALFKAIDRDGNGQIDKKEAKAADLIDTYQGKPKQIAFEGKSWNATPAIGAEVVEFKGKQALHIVGREQCLVSLPIEDFPKWND